MSSSCIDLTICALDQVGRLGGWKVLQEEEVLEDRSAIKFFEHHSGIWRPAEWDRFRAAREALYELKMKIKLLVE